MSYIHSPKYLATKNSHYSSVFLSIFSGSFKSDRVWKPIKSKKIPPAAVLVATTRGIERKIERRHSCILCFYTFRPLR